MTWGLLSAANLEQSYLWLQWDSSQFFAETGQRRVRVKIQSILWPKHHHPSYIIEVLVTSGIDNINNLHHLIIFLWGRIPIYPNTIQSFWGKRKCDPMPSGAVSHLVSIPRISLSWWSTLLGCSRQQLRSCWMWTLFATDILWLWHPMTHDLKMRATSTYHSGIFKVQMEWTAPPLTCNGAATDSRKDEVLHPSLHSSKLLANVIALSCPRDLQREGKNWNSTGVAVEGNWLRL